MNKISVCMIVKNEQDVLARCLDCVCQFADEIIIVDTGSIDNTKEIARRYTDKIFDFEWCDDFSKARNYSFGLTTCEYVMWLDADDIIEYDEIEKINQLKLNMTADTYMLKYATSFDKLGNPSFVFNRERIVRNDCRAVWKGFVHEAIAPFGKVEYLDITIQHRKVAQVYTKRNLNLFRKALKQGIKFNAREQYYYARELYYWGYYKSSLTQLKKFFKIPHKFLPNLIDGFLIASKCEEKLGNIANAKKWLYEGLNIAPNSEIVCELARLYAQSEKYENAIYLYQSALNIAKPKDKGFFVREEYYYLIPMLELVILCYKIGNYDMAKHYHLKLKLMYPDNEKVLFNDRFFLD